MRAKNKSKRFNVDYTDEEHAIVQRRAKACKSMHEYIVRMTVDGKLPKKSK